MPMNGNNLGTDIAAAVALVPKETAAPVDYWQAVANAIVAHITANAVVNTTDTVTSVSGVTTGMGTSGPGTGTGVGTVS